MQKTIGVLTSGGDAPGMNAAVRAVTRAAIKKGFRVVGIRRGYNGLLNNDMVELTTRDVADIIQRGGTEIFTARCKEFREWEYVLKAKDICVRDNFAGIVVIGGDGSFRGAADLSKAGIPCVGLPGTIDNDIQCSEYTIGYDTAMNTVMELVDKLRDTSHSHERCAVVEVMGRNAGHIALNTGVACGATAILVPEIEFDIEDVIQKIKNARANGKEQFIVIVAEVTPRRYPSVSTRRPASSPELLSWVTFREAAALQYATGSLLPRWATMQLSCSRRASATAL